MNTKPIRTAPKDGTNILIHEPSQGGWIQAHWEEPWGGLPGRWESDHHCEWYSPLDPDYWTLLPAPTPFPSSGY